MIDGGGKGSGEDDGRGHKHEEIPMILLFEAFDLLGSGEDVLLIEGFFRQILVHAEHGPDGNHDKEGHRGREPPVNVPDDGDDNDQRDAQRTGDEAALLVRREPTDVGLESLFHQPVVNDLLLVEPFLQRGIVLPHLFQFLIDIEFFFVHGTSD